jgi:hypothetical protein
MRDRNAAITLAGLIIFMLFFAGYVVMTVYEGGLCGG